MTVAKPGNEPAALPALHGTARRKKPNNQQQVISMLHTPFTAWGILFCGLLATLFAWKLSTDYLHQQIEQRFNTRVDELTTAIEERMLVYEQLLWSGVALFNASDDVKRADWHNFISSLDIQNHWKGAQGLGFSIPVNKDERAAHIARQRVRGSPDYAITPVYAREKYTAIIYLEPLDWRNRRAIGYDMWSNELRREAMRRARDSGQAATSGLVELVQETDSDIQRGFLTYVPVYRNGITPATLEQRRELFEGWVYAAFRSGDLMQRILRERDTDIALQIFDGTRPTNANLLFDSGLRQARSATTSIDSSLHAHRTIEVQGRRWTLQFESNNTHLSALERNQPNFIAAGGLIVDVLLFYIIASLARANTIQKEMTKELERAKKQLEHKVKRRTFALEQERRHLEERVRDSTVQLREKVYESEALIAELTDTNENLRQFSYVASHDLKEPLRMVVSFTELLAQNYADKLDDSGREYIEIAADSGKRMQTMIDDLLQYTRLDHNSERLKKVDCNVELEHVLRDYSVAIRDQQIQVSHDLLPVIRCNPSRLLTVLRNLVGNSIKYGKSEGPGQIRVGAEETATDWVFNVADNGIGIDEKFHQRVFEPFKRLHSHSQYSGTGLGLAICKKIVNTWGGKIWLVSQPNIGTTFYFSVPRDVALQCRRAPDALAEII